MQNPQPETYLEKPVEELLVELTDTQKKLRAIIRHDFQELLAEESSRRQLSVLRMWNIVKHVAGIVKAEVTSLLQSDS